MTNYLELDEAEAANILYGMYETEWPELAAVMMGIPVQSISHVTVIQIDGIWTMVVTEV